MRRIVILGATSAIATAIARILASQGHALFLAGRNAPALQSLQDDLQARGAHDVHSAVFDASDWERSPNILDQAAEALAGLDTAIVAYGTLPDQRDIQNDPLRVAAEIDTNFRSIAAWLSILATRFERQGRGTIVGISSVAGERGRAVNYVYGSAKAGMTCFMSGLRQRLAKKGVYVLTVKPGFVDTPMTAGFAKGPLWSAPDRVARGIVYAMDHRRCSIYLPGYWSLIMFCIRLLPERLFVRMKF